MTDGLFGTCGVASDPLSVASRRVIHRDGMYCFTLKRAS